MKDQLHHRLMVKKKTWDLEPRTSNLEPGVWKQIKGGDQWLTMGSTDASGPTGDLEGTGVPVPGTGESNRILPGSDHVIGERDLLTGARVMIGERELTGGSPDWIRFLEEFLGTWLIGHTYNPIFQKFC